YAFDDIGNRVGTGAGGDENGLNLRWALYAANELNQYWSNTVPAAVDVLGVSLATSAVQVNGLAAYRKGEYFRKELPVDNSGGPVWTNVTVTAAGQSAVSGHAAVAPALQGFSYDLDGNLTQDGLWVYTWDGENRLVAVESVWGVAEAGRRRVDFGYDAQGRRVEQVVSGWDGQGWGYVPQSTNRFVYDGWNLVAVLDGNNAPLLSFTWGTDLSGSVQGAGGVGGLSSLTVHTGPNAGRYFYAYDGNGNVMALVSAADGSVAARYEYGPFGELIRATGPMAKANPFRFSTRYQDEETGLVYYGHRYYDPSTGRWPNRDPLANGGVLPMVVRPPARFRMQPWERIEGPNLYTYALNDPINFVDINGLWTRGFGFTFSYGFGIGGSVSIGFYWGKDEQTGAKSMGLLVTPGLGAGFPPNIFVGGFYQKTNAKCVNQLKGLGYQMGAGGGEGVGGGADLVGGSGYQGFDVQGGATFGSPIEGHALGTLTFGWDNDKQFGQ
ncbi:MAG TPA: RHS repeat-associated core domain-containing protein, partial [Candidatus Paceibacterota bacterium]|nr:RHS repeat-associated core domain-containing protein [Candidatus Paceibacterota bacterium]